MKINYSFECSDAETKELTGFYSRTLGMLLDMTAGLLRGSEIREEDKPQPVESVPEHWEPSIEDSSDYTDIPPWPDESWDHPEAAPIWNRDLGSAASSMDTEDHVTPEYLKGKVHPVTPSAPEHPAVAGLPKLSDSVRAEAWSAFRDLCVTWSTNFNVEGKEQPDRLEALRLVGTGKHAMPILIMAYELGSLQRLVGNALAESWNEDDAITASPDLCDQIAANMVQVSHMVFPDLAGTYDYSTKWRRGW